MYVADSGRAVDILLPGQSPESFLPVVAALENPFANFIQADGMGAPEVEQSFHFHREQRDDSVGKIPAADAASIFVVKKRHGKTAFQSSLDKVDCPFFPLYGITHGKAEADDGVPGRRCNFLFREQIGFAHDTDGIGLSVSEYPCIDVLSPEKTRSALKYMM